MLKLIDEAQRSGARLAKVLYCEVVSVSAGIMREVSPESLASGARARSRNRSRLDLDPPTESDARLEFLGSLSLRSLTFLLLQCRVFSGKLRADSTALSGPDVLAAGGGKCDSSSTERIAIHF